MTETAFPELDRADRAGDHVAVIDGLRAAVEDDRRTALTDPWAQRWIGRRWRNLFVTEASTDPDALDALRRFAGMPVKITTGPLREQARLDDRVERARWQRW